MTVVQASSPIVEGFRTRRTPTKSVPYQKPLYRNLRVIQENHLEGSQSWEASAQDVILTAIERRQMPPRPGGILPLTDASGQNELNLCLLCVFPEQDADRYLHGFGWYCDTLFKLKLGAEGKATRCAFEILPVGQLPCSIGIAPVAQR